MFVVTGTKRFDNLIQKNNHLKGRLKTFRRPLFKFK